MASAMHPRLERLVAEHVGEGVVAGRMFGTDTVLLDGELVACARHGRVGFRLRAGEQLDAALELPGAGEFDPFGTGNPFREWVSLPLQPGDALDELLSLAVALRRAA